MAEIVDLRLYKTKAAEQRGFDPWRKRFGEVYNHNTKLSDVSDRTLYFLALPGEERAMAFYELIMGGLDTGKGMKFYYLEKKEQMRVMDIHLFLADQVRFEMMRRLGWLAGFPCETYSLLEMVLDFDGVKARCENRYPELSESHPDYLAYKALSRMDMETFIRRMFPDAVKTFQERSGL